MNTPNDESTTQALIDAIRPASADDTTQVLFCVASLNRLACLRLSQERDLAALMLCQAARRIGGDSLGDGHIELVLTHGILALLNARRGDLEAAEGFHAKVNKLIPQVMEMENCVVMEILYRNAQYHEALGHGERAEADFRRALAATKKAFGPGHPHVKRILALMSAFYNTRGDARLARLCLRKMDLAGSND